MRYVFIVNPVAGKENSEKLIRSLVGKCFDGRDVDYKICLTEGRNYAYEIAKSEAELGDEVAVFACGGDGTVFEVLNGIVGHHNASLGVIPVGSANDFLKFFDEKEKDAFLNIRDQIAGEGVPTDIIKVEDKYCLNICSAGMDAVVGAGMAKFKKLPMVSGPAAYNLSLVKTFVGKLGINIKTTIDGVEYPAADYLFAVCANGPCYGGGWRSAPDANPFDGKLDYVMVNKISKFMVLAFLKDYKRGKIAQYPFSRTGRCEEMTLESDKPFPVNLDGEIIYFKKATFSIVKKGVKFILPNSISAKYVDKILTILK